MDERPGGKILRRLDLGEFFQVSAPDVFAERKVHEFSVTFGFDEAGVLELLDVVRQGGRSHSDVFAKVGTGDALAGGDALKNLEARRVGDRAGDEIELPLGESYS
jgi:hypothetical protein